jgi:hypothetical protein
MSGQEKKIEISDDLKGLVATTLDSIKDALQNKKAGVMGAVEFEIAAIKSKEVGGGFRFLVADASGNYSKESVSKIRFHVVGYGAVPSSQLWLKDETK